MKRFLPVFAVLLLLQGFASYVKAGDTIVATQEKLEKQLARAERWQRWSPMATNSALQEIVDLMKKPVLTSETKREATKRLIRIYYAIDDSMTNNANKKRILEAIGHSDPGPEAQEFFLKVLDSDNAEYRNMALWSLNSPYGVHGAAIYAKIQSLEQRGVLTKGHSLVELAKADPSRAIPEMKEFLRTTQELKDFVAVSLNLPKEARHNPDVLDVIVERYGDFKGKPKTEKDAGLSPEDAIWFPDLWAYIDAREGYHLKNALGMLRAQGVCGVRDISRLEKKIKGNDVFGREAVVEFFAAQIDSGNLPKEKVLPILKEARVRESDQKLKRKLGDIIERHNKGGEK